MLKKFVFNCLRNFNAAFGMVSLTTIALGTVATFSGLESDFFRGRWHWEYGKMTQCQILSNNLSSTS
jgi:hypothetical protein